MLFVIYLMFVFVAWYCGSSGTSYSPYRVGNYGLPGTVAAM